MGNRKDDQIGQTPWHRLYRGVSSVSPQVFSYFYGKNVEDFDRIIIRQKSNGDWWAMMKRYSDDGSVEIAFGNGFDFGAALLGLNGAIAAGKWRKDKPFEAKK